MAGVVLISCAPAAATVRTWTGASDSYWTNPANWGGVAPVAGDDLVFTGPATRVDTTNDFPVGTEFRSITFIHGDNCLNYVVRGNAIRLGDGGLADAYAFCSDSIIELPITLSASQTWKNEWLIVNAPLDINGKTLTFNPDGNSHVFPDGGFVGSGSIVLKGSTQLLNIAGVNHFTGTLINNATGGFVQIDSDLNVAYTQNSDFAILKIESNATVASIEITRGSVDTYCSSTSNSRCGFNSGSIKLGAATRYDEYLAGPQRVATAHVTGTVTLNSAQLRVLGGGLHPGDQVMIIENDGVDPVIGTFAGSPEGSTLIGPDAYRYSISYIGGTGNDVVLTVLPDVVASVTLTSSLQVAARGEPVTFTATVHGTPTPRGSVTFFDGGFQFASANLNSQGVVSVTTTSMPLGVHTVSARYNGDTTYPQLDSPPITVTISLSVPSLNTTALILLACALAGIGMTIAPKV
jgi:hypothetical protein